MSKTPHMLDFEKFIAILKFATKFFTSYRWAADIFLDFFLSIIS